MPFVDVAPAKAKKGMSVKMQIEIVKNMKKQTKGITLVALVVTIIVLLILAGVAISLTIGNNGIFNRAQKAKDAYAMSDLKEEASMIMGSRDIDGEIGTKIGLKEDLEQGIKGNKIIEEVNGLTDVYYVTRDNQSITVYEDGDIVEGKVNIWNGSSKSKPEVDEEKNWHIYTAEELKYFADFVNGNLTEEEKEGLTIEETTKVYLENNLDLGARQTEGTLTNGSKWTAIGKTAKFIGTFEGNNHFIKGVYIDQTENYAGLFSQANIIKKLTIKDSYILGRNGVGGIAGVGDTIEDCHNNNTTVISREGNYYIIEGIVGQIKTTISNCSNSGEVIANGIYSNGHSQAGGIAGLANTSSTINNCSNSGKITGKGNRVGGIVGASNTSSTITKCRNSGAVTGKGGDVGGIAGLSPKSGTINNCSNRGTVEGKGGYVGGISGLASSSCTTSNCSNSGKITGEGECVGGIVGIANPSNTIIECSNNGTVTGKERGVGGIVGTTFGNIEGCYNVGNITGEGAFVGGIAGNTDTSSKMSNCSNRGVVTGKGNDVGGIVGLLFGNLEKCYNIGEIKQTGGVGNLGGICGSIGTNCTANIKNCYNMGKIIEENNKNARYRRNYRLGI